MKRQHEGKDGSSHARFMMSACHDFQEAFKSKKSKNLLSNFLDSVKYLAHPFSQRLRTKMETDMWFFSLVLRSTKLIATDALTDVI